MSGESKLSTELGGGILTGIHHDQQTRDIRAIEAQALIFSQTVSAQSESVNQLEDSVANIDNRTKSGFNTVAINTSGSVDEMSSSLGITELKNNIIYVVLCIGSNLTSTPTLNLDNLGAKIIVKGNDLPLAINDIPGVNFVGLFRYSPSLDKFILLNPAGFSHNGLNINVNNITSQDIVADDISADQITAANFLGDGSQLSNTKWQGSTKTVSTVAPTNEQGVSGDIWFQVAP